MEEALRHRVVRGVEHAWVVQIIWKIGRTHKVGIVLDLLLLLLLHHVQHVVGVRPEGLVHRLRKSLHVLKIRQCSLASGHEAGSLRLRLPNLHQLGLPRRYLRRKLLLLLCQHVISVVATIGSEHVLQLDLLYQVALLLILLCLLRHQIILGLVRIQLDVRAIVRSVLLFKRVSVDR